MQPLVSILFPCYNAETFIRHSLESLLHQSYSNLEIICINDGSSDKTLEILMEYQKKDQRIIIVNNEVNLGLIDSLNKGLQYVNGTYFGRMDADDYSPPDRIQEEVDFLLKHEDIELITTGSYYFKSDHRKEQYLPPVAIKSNAIKFLSLFVNPIVHGSLLGKTSLIKSGKYIYSKEYPHAEDFELFSRLAGSGVIISSINKPLYWIRINLSSVSFKYAGIQVATNLKIIKRNVSGFLSISEFPDDIILKVAVNKIDEVPEFYHITEAYRFLGMMYELMNRKSAFTPEENQEIKQFLSIHKLNIIIQANKIRFKQMGLRNSLFFIRSLKYVRIRQLAPFAGKLKKSIFS